LARVRVDFGELGVTGLKRHGGEIAEEFLPQLTGSRAIQVYTEMANNDPVVAAMLFAVNMMMRQVSFSITPAADTPKALWAKEFMESVLSDMSQSFEDTLDEIYSFLVYGWSFHEIVYKRRLGETGAGGASSKYADGYIGWRKLPIRAQSTLYEWEFDEAGGVQAMLQLSPLDYSIRRIPIEKALLFRTEARKGSPEGKSILRTAYRAWYFKKRIEEIEGIGIERDLAGLPVAWVPAELLDPAAGPSERAILNAMREIVTNIRRDEQEGIIFPLEYDEGGNKLYDLELLSTGGRRQFDINATITRYDERIAMSILADFILLGHDRVGSLALGKGKIELFTTAITAWLDSVVAVFNRHGIPRLWRLNGFDLVLMPELTHSGVKAPDLKELAEYIDRLSDAGLKLFPSDELEGYLREIAGLPLRER